MLLAVLTSVALSPSLCQEINVQHRNPPPLFLSLFAILHRAIVIQWLARSPARPLARSLVAISFDGCHSSKMAPHRWRRRQEGLGSGAARRHRPQQSAPPPVSYLGGSGRSTATGSASSRAAPVNDGACLLTGNFLNFATRQLEFIYSPPPPPTTLPLSGLHLARRSLSLSRCIF